MHRIRLTWGGSSQDLIHWLMRLLRNCFGIQGLSLFARSGRLPDQINLTFGRRGRRLHQDSACGG